MTDDRKPWERRGDETDAQWHAFKIYRDMGLARSARKTWAKYRQQRDLVGDEPHKAFWAWMQSNDWEDRAEAYDRHEDRRGLEMREKARRQVRDMLARHALRATARLVALSAGVDSIEEVDLESADISEQELDAIYDHLDRLGIDSPQEIDLSGGVTATTESAVDLDLNLEALEFDELTDLVEALGKATDGSPAEILGLDTDPTE